MNHDILSAICEQCGHPITLDRGVWVDETGGDVCCHDLAPNEVPDDFHQPPAIIVIQNRLFS